MGKLKKGLFITFEGPEGSGKSSLIRFTRRYFGEKGFSVVCFREPGSTKIGEKIRRVLLDTTNKGMSAKCETMLYIAARNQLVLEKIIPNLKKGKVVICDRYSDSTLAYQGFAGGEGIKLVSRINDWATFGTKPNVTFLLDVGIKKGLARGGRRDRIELKSYAFHNRVRDGFLKLAKLYPKRICIIRDKKTLNGKEQEVRKRLDKIVKSLKKQTR